MKIDGNLNGENDIDDGLPPRWNILDRPIVGPSASVGALRALLRTSASL